MQSVASHVLAKFVSHQTLTKERQLKIWTLTLTAFYIFNALRFCSNVARFSLDFYFRFLLQFKCALTHLKQSCTWVKVFKCARQLTDRGVGFKATFLCA